MTPPLSANINSPIIVILIMYIYCLWWVFKLHVNKRSLHTLYYAGTDAFKCIAQGESTDV